jgi:threonine/homoserine/homoserine lactone efflux protein
MSFDLLAAFLLFAAVMLFTPGPNNIMLMSSGLNFGFARTLPHMLGVSLGFGLMVFLVGIGLGAIFRIYPALYLVLKYAGAAYLLYLA